MPIALLVLCDAPCESKKNHVFLVRFSRFGRPFGAPGRGSPPCPGVTGHRPPIRLAAFHVLRRPQRPGGLQMFLGRRREETHRPPEQGSHARG